MKLDVSFGLLRQAMAASRDGVAIVDVRSPAMPVVYVNPAFERLTGYRADEVLGSHYSLIERGDARQPEIDPLRETLRTGESCVVTLRNFRKDGSAFWNELTLAPIRDRYGHITHVMGTMSDVTEHVAAEQRFARKRRALEKTMRMLEDLALMDGLTGLYNRRHFNAQLEREWNRARREHCPVSLMMIDIDHFKRFNDTYGHVAGDRWLTAVAETLRGCFARGSDLVARYGGEEFVVLIYGAERDPARERAEMVQSAVRNLSMQGAGPSAAPAVTVSIGLATTIPDRGVSPEDLLMAADRSLYQAKRQGRDRIVQAPELANAAPATVPVAKPAEHKVSYSASSATASPSTASLRARHARKGGAHVPSILPR